MTTIEYRVPVEYRGYEMTVVSDYRDNDVYQLSTDIYAALDNIWIRWPYTTLLLTMELGLIFTMFGIFGPSVIPVIAILASVIYMTPYANMADVEYLTEEYSKSKGYTGIKIYWTKVE